MDDAVADADAVKAAARVVRVVRNNRMAETKAAQVRPAPSPSPLPAMEASPAVRVDKWLWSVRLFRTRTAAAAACTAGKVKVNGSTVKPARTIRTGDTIEANNGTLTRTVKVTVMLDRRVGAALVGRHLEDLTPASEYEAARERSAAPAGHRPPGAGRPTKRDRRILQSFFGHEE